jgi:carbon storage regulator
MLILTRRSNERIFIGDDVVLVVLGIENNRVKLGIEAPSEISILREEISGERRSQNIDKLSGNDLDGGPGYKTGT